MTVLTETNELNTKVNADSSHLSKSFSERSSTHNKVIPINGGKTLPLTVAMLINSIENPNQNFSFTLVVNAGAGCRLKFGMGYT